MARYYILEVVDNKFVDDKRMGVVVSALVLQETKLGLKMYSIIVGKILSDKEGIEEKLYIREENKIESKDLLWLEHEPAKSIIEILRLLRESANINFENLREEQENRFKEIFDRYLKNRASQ